MFGWGLSGYRSDVDAMSLLRAEHKIVEALFKQFEQAGTGAAARSAGSSRTSSKSRRCTPRSRSRCSIASIRQEVKGIESDVLESLEEHHIVKWVLSELDGMDPQHEWFDAKVTVLIGSVRHHVKKEETSGFPDVQAALGRKRLSEIGDLLANAKQLPPTRLHPRSSDTPPGNKVVGTTRGAGRERKVVAQEGIGAPHWGSD